MKKNIIGISALVIVGTGVFISCKKDVKATNNQTKSTSSNNARVIPAASYSELGLNITQVTTTISSNQRISDILSSTLVTSALTSEGWSIDSDNLFTKMTDGISGRYGYVLDLVSNQQNVESSIVIIPIDESKGIYDVIFAKAVTVGGVKSTYARSIVDSYPYSNLDPVYMSTDEKVKLFRAQFKACMAAAWNDITGSVSGIVACSLAPGPCVLACVVYCSSGMAVPSDCEATTTQEAIDCLCSHDLIDCSDVVAEDGITYVPTF